MKDPKPTAKRPRKRVKAVHVLFLVAAVAATIALAWWQWTRFQSGSGTFQNLGYALQWPLFGAFFVFAYRKYLQYENRMIDAKNAGEDGPFELRSSRPGGGDGPTEIEEGFLPERPEPKTPEEQPARPRRRGDGDLSGLPGGPQGS